LIHILGAPSKKSIALRQKNNSRFQSFDDILDELDFISGGHKAKDLKCPHPLLPFQNIIVRNNSTSGSVIPRILHVSMKSRCLPQDLVRTLKKWNQQLPNHSIFFHDDEAVSNFIHQNNNKNYDDYDSNYIKNINHWEEHEFPELRKASQCILYKGAMQIDIWRVLILYKYGGTYTDIDNWPTNQMNESAIAQPYQSYNDDHNHTSTSAPSAYFLIDPANRPSQWFMSIESHHPIMYLAMTQIIQNVFNMEDIRRPRTVFVTGPGAVKDAYFNFIARFCCNGATSTKKLSVNDVPLKGMFGKFVYKSSRKDLINIKYGYKDLVPYVHPDAPNITLNVTRESRIEKESGVGHWTNARKNGSIQLKTTVPDKHSSCRNYLHAIENGLIAAIPVMSM